MTWVKLDDQWADHPKLIGLPDLAQLLWVKGLTYSCRHRTNGFIPKEALSRMLSVRNTKQLESKITGCGLWLPCEGGYMIHDFEDYQPISDKLSALRSEAGKKGAAARWKPDAPDGNCHADANGNSVPKLDSRASAPGRALDLISESEGSAEGGRPETGYDRAWRLWQVAWSGKYKRAYSLAPDTSLRSELRVLQRVGGASLEQADPDAWLAHKFAGYLRDKGDRNYLADHEHPLRCLERDWNNYGEPPRKRPPESATRVKVDEPAEKPVPPSEALTRAQKAIAEMQRKVGT